MKAYYVVQSPPRAKRNRAVHEVVSRSNGTTVKTGLSIAEAQRLTDVLTQGCTNETQRAAWNLIEQGWTDSEIADELEVLQKYVAEFRKRRNELVA